MNPRLIFSIAKTQLLSRIKQSAIAGLGVTFGIGAFIILVSFMTGLNKMLDDLVLDRTPHIRIYNEIKPSEQQAVELLDPDGFHLVRSVQPKKEQAKIHNGPAILNYLRNKEEVIGATPKTNAQVFYLSGSIELGGLINGVDILEEDRLFNISNYIVKGTVRDLANNDNGILLGAGLAKKMSVGVGDRIQIVSTTGDIFPLKIVGIYQSGLAEIDNTQSYANIKTAQRMLGRAGSYFTDINVKLNDIELAVPMSRSLARQFKVSALDIKKANAQFETGTSIRNMITYAVSITLLIVAGFGIYNILNMMIYEKMNDIAILKATGFSGSDVKWIFITQALLIGIIGGALGMAIGYGVSVLIDHTPFETEALPTIKTFPVLYESSYYITGIVFALVTTFLSGYLPARKAQKVDPVEIIRGQ